ncbi:MAG: cytochrome c [Candidatus Acidiferrales bacterium]
MKTAIALIMAFGISAGGCLLAAQSRPPGMQSLDTKETLGRGQAVFQKNCSICHYAASTQKKIGPGLRGLTARGRFADGTRVDSHNLTRWIQEGGKNMPPFRNQLTDAQMRDLLAYIRTL